MANKDWIQSIIEEEIRENWNYDEGFEQKRFEALRNKTFARFKASDFDNANEYDGYKRVDYPSAKAYFDVLFDFAFEVVGEDIKDEEFEAESKATEKPTPQATNKATKKKGKGWKEAPDHTGKAPRHKAVATKKKLSKTARKPIKETDWKVIAKKELEKTLKVKTKVGTYEYYENLGAIALVTASGKANNGEREWIVFETPEEAEAAALAKVKEDLETEPSLFTESWLLTKIDEEKAERVFREIYDEQNKSYARDIESEDSDKYTNRLAEEMVERGIITEEEGHDEDTDLAIKIDDFVKDMTDSQIDDGSGSGAGGYDYYKSNIGEDEAKKILFDNNLIDIDSAAQDAIDVDGVSHFLDGYDGEVVELPSGAVAYGTN